MPPTMLPDSPDGPEDDVPGTARAPRPRSRPKVAPAAAAAKVTATTLRWGKAAPEADPAPTPKATAARARRSLEQRTRVAKQASSLLKFVSDPTRLRVLLILVDGERHVGALCEQLEQSQPAVSHHLALLRHGGIIVPHRVGKNNFYTLSDSGRSLAEVARVLLQAE